MSRDSKAVVSWVLILPQTAKRQYRHGLNAMANATSEPLDTRRVLMAKSVANAEARVLERLRVKQHKAEGQWGYDGRERGAGASRV